MLFLRVKAIIRHTFKLDLVAGFYIGGSYLSWGSIIEVVLTLLSF